MTPVENCRQCLDDIKKCRKQIKRSQKLLKKALRNNQFNEQIAYADNIQMHANILYERVEEYHSENLKAIERGSKWKTETE